MKRYQTSSAQETMELGQKLGEALLRLPMPPNAKSKSQKVKGVANAARKAQATVVTLSGELGAGKTTLTKGIYKGLGSKAAVTSPTFIIMRHTHIKSSKGVEKDSGKNKKEKALRYKTLVHIDAYRLQDPKALNQIGFGELLQDPSALLVIEWPERTGKLISKKVIAVTLKHGKTTGERSVVIQGVEL